MAPKIPVGWREWLSLPELDIIAIKAKVDTGAKTSALHAYYVEPFNKMGELWVRFDIHPNQDDFVTTQRCEARVVDRREVTDSGGHTEERYVIETQILIGQKDFTAEMTLTNRDSMKFRMLLGRNALKGRFYVDSDASYLQGKAPKY